MRIGIDYYPATTHAPGVGRYARELTRALVGLDGSHELRLLDLGRGRRAIPRESLGLASDTFVRRLEFPARLRNFLGHVGLGAERLLGGVDIFHQVRLNGPPVRSAPQTFAVSEWPDSAGESAFLGRLENFAQLFVFCTEYRDRLVGLTGRDPETIHIVPVGADHWLRDLGRPPETVDRSYPPRVLVLGAAYPERQHLLILEACEALSRAGRELQLVFAGSTSVGAAELRSRIASSDLGELVVWRAPEERELPELVAQSSLLVHLCEDAGTAVTPLESLLLNVPVLVSPVPAFCEVLGDAASTFDGGGAEALAAAIHTALSRPPSTSERAQLARRYCWRENALASLAAWEGVV
jgi:glycosyltransferase involved in cell wall biosynthesis